MIKPVKIGSIDRAMEIFRSAVSDMEKKNIRQWDEVYPDRETVSEDILSGTMYGYFVGEVLCAVQVINQIQSPEYSQIDWKYRDENPLVLHRLCVDPEYRNRGIAKQMILFAEKYAADNGFRTIRFDAFINNPVSVHIYEKAGYFNSGTVRFRKGDFYCFEKKTVNYPDE